MILTEIKHYLMQRNIATLRDIALHVDANPDAVRGMLDHWVRKGQVSRQLATASCGSSCTKCDTDATEIYRWQDRNADRVIAIHPARLVQHCDVEGLKKT
jgi:predicted ArsR family transcriptional regulator